MCYFFMKHRVKNFIDKVVIKNMENILKNLTHSRNPFICWEILLVAVCLENWPNCVKSHMREIQFDNPFSQISS